MNIELLLVFVLIAVGFGAGFVQRVSGFGLGIFTMLFLPYFMPSHAAAATISCLFSVGTSTYNAIRYRKNICYKIAIPLLISAGISIPIAIYFSARVPKGVFEILLGVVLILLSIYFLFFNRKIHIRPTTSSGIIAGAIGGTLSGLFSTGGPPIVLYLSHATNDNTVYFATIQFYFCLTNIYATANRAINGIITPEILIYGAIGLAGCMLGDFVGRFVFDKLDSDKLKTVIYIGMIISGALMLF